MIKIEILSYGFEVTYNDVTSTSEGKNISVSNNKSSWF